MLTAGTRLGIYEVASLLGKGGMGEVYRAKDTRLGRDVALKVLPEAFASDHDRLARFEREAHVLASLTHANIGALYSLEESLADDGRTTRALVLELVEGDTLADRLARGPLPLDEALPIARQIAEALEAAHERGVIHRDLKPANVKVTPGGVVKVLDFGLAKAMDSAGAAGATVSPAHGLSMSPTFAPTTSPTIAMPGATVAGIILGTAAYMAPEQAKGRPADKRSDLWAFGCVLYEMLCGRPVFTGEDVSEILAEVIKAHVAWERLPPETPASVRRLLRRCLVKDPKARIADAGVARLEIDDAVGHADASSPIPAAQTPQKQTRPYAFAAAGVLLGALGAGAVAFGIANRGAETAVQPTRFPVMLPAGVQLATNASQRLVLAPDGRKGVLQRRLGRCRAALRPQPGPAGADGCPRRRRRPGEPLPVAGRRVDRLQRRSYRAVQEGANQRRPTGDDLRRARGDGRVCRRDVGLWRTHRVRHRQCPRPDAGSRSGRHPSQLTTPDGEQHRQPSFLPEGQALLFTLVKGGQPDQVAVLRLGDGTWKPLAQGSSPRFAPSGHLVFLREAALWATAFDPNTLETSGDAVPVLEGVGRQGAIALYSVAFNGALAYSPISPSLVTRTLVWVDRSGREEAIPAPARAYVRLRLSPDGSMIALEARDQEDDIWLWHLARRTLTRLTFGRAEDQAPVWTPDGRRIVFNSTRAGAQSLFRQPADGTGAVEPLTQGSPLQVPDSIGTDGTLVFTDNGGGGNDVLAMQLPRQPTNGSEPADARVRPLVKTDRQERGAAVSPDGKWLAYESNASGATQIFVRPYPDTSAGLWQVSTSGGVGAVWARDSRELFFINDGMLMRVRVEPGSTSASSVPEPVVKGPHAFGAVLPYDISPDGRRFVFLKDGTATAAQPAGPAIVVVENWTEELRRLVK